MQQQEMHDEDSFDYIVVGAGSAGCTIAARLVHLLPTVRVALLESGKDYFGSNDDFNADISDPKKVGSTWDGPAERGYRTVPQKGLNHRRLALLRGNGVGGCSLINVMLWFRGFKDDWDQMPEGWNSSSVEKEFEWIEDRLQISTIEANDLGKQACAAANSIGITKSDGDGLWDSNGTSDKTRATIAPDGRRQDIYRALGANHERVTLVKGAAERILFATSSSSSKAATGVLIRISDGSTRKILVKDGGGEVILSCGAIDTPKLMQLSGVGPPKLLDALGIPIVHPLVAVGEGLRDHPWHPMVFEIKEHPGKLSPNSVIGWLQDPSSDVQIIFTDGNLTTYFVPYALLQPWLERIGGTRAERALNAIILAVMQVLVAILRVILASLPPFRHKLETSMSFLIAVTKPKSVGSVMICSRDSSVAPNIDLGLYSNDEDMKTMLRGFSKVRELVRAPPLSGIIGAELLVGGGENEVETIRAKGSIYHHSTGTCAMGTCLDNQLRVHGVRQLRVADASSLPLHPRVPTNAASMVVGARCASLIAQQK
jgi:choline dehydrogenase